MNKYYWLLWRDKPKHKLLKRKEELDKEYFEETSSSNRWVDSEKVKDIEEELEVIESLLNENPFHFIP